MFLEVILSELSLFELCQLLDTSHLVGKACGLWARGLVDGD